jgi:hypothetical protein
MRTKHYPLMMTLWVALFLPTAINATELLSNLGSCNPTYFKELAKYAAVLSNHGVSLSLKNDIARVVPLDSMNIAHAHAQTQPPILIEGLEVTGFIDAVATDEITKSTSYIWGISTLSPVHVAANLINALLPEDKKLQEIHKDVYLRSERIQLSDRESGWGKAPFLRHGTPSRGIVAKGLIIENVLSIDNVPPEGRTWVTCEIHGKEIPIELLREERPDVVR